MNALLNHATMVEHVLTTLIAINVFALQHIQENNAKWVEMKLKMESLNAH